MIIKYPLSLSLSYLIKAFLWLILHLQCSHIWQCGLVIAQIIITEEDVERIILLDLIVEVL